MEHNTDGAPRSECEQCDDLGWEWHHGLGGESWKVPCPRHCAAAEKWLADEHGVKEGEGC
jgi:hypothetical protein